MKILKTKDVKTPQKAHESDGGFDFFIPSTFETVHLAPNKGILIDTGLKILIPDGYVGVFQNKSSIGSKGLVVAANIVDSNFRGEVFINLFNISDTPIQINPGQKIVQMLIHRVPYLTIKEITEEEFNEDVTERGSGALGSTGAY